VVARDQAPEKLLRSLDAEFRMVQSELDAEKRR
jgi:hypothetical protein